MMRRGGRAPARFPADRYVTAVARFPIYRRAGRCPSRVYVDDAMRPAPSGLPARRLFDNVFWRTFAEIDDQIEDRAGGLLLLTKDLGCHPIQLSAPRPLEVATAFGHADAVLREDRKILDGLLAKGAVVAASPHRSRVAPSRPPDTMFAEDHPLVVTAQPRNVEEGQPPRPNTRGTGIVSENDLAGAG